MNFFLQERSWLVVGRNWSAWGKFRSACSIFIIIGWIEVLRESIEVLGTILSSLDKFSSALKCMGCLYHHWTNFEVHGASIEVLGVILTSLEKFWSAWSKYWHAWGICIIVGRILKCLRKYWSVWGVFIIVGRILMCQQHLIRDDESS